MSASVASPGRGTDGVFFGGLALLFILAVGATWNDVVSMAAMPGMPMPGGWTMSMMWMRMPGQSGFAALLAFLDMWMPMMALMMLPVLAPMLHRYRSTLRDATGVRREVFVAAAAVGYFCIWGVLGLAIFPLGILLAELAMRNSSVAQAAPLALGALVIVAGLAQFSVWKARHLACWCQSTIAVGNGPASFATAWQHGLRLGRHCVYCCAGPTAVLLAVGSMNPGAMIAATAVIAIERLAPDPRRVARYIGVVAIVAGVGLIIAALLSVADHGCN